MRAKIVLEDGAVFEGFSFGKEGESFGEVVFNTSLTGYQEILTDPSYKGQIVTMTYPLIGNYGVNNEDGESLKPFAEGFIVREYSRLASNWRATKSLPDYLKENNIMGIEGVDTRALTRHIRLKGAMKAVVSTDDLDERSLVEKVRHYPSLVGRDLVQEVTCRQAYTWAPPSTKDKGGGEKFKVVVIDCGVKFNILRQLRKNNCYVAVVPAETTAEKIMEMGPEGVLLSNGPGDPQPVSYLIETVKKLIIASSHTYHPLPIMGICLGHQILGLALGGRTYKLKFGHHGGNHPVKDLRSGKIAITAQNHGFCVDINSLNKNEIDITHINLNDNTLEGMRHKKLPIFSVQFHPESSPGPHDAQYLLGEFIGMMSKH